MIARWGRPYAFALLLLVSLAVVGVLGRWGGRTSTAGPVPPKLGVNLIAYADLDGQIMTSHPDGSSPAKLSPDLGFFTWPVWSPDSNQLAFSGIPLEGTMPGDLTLYHVDLDDAEPRAIFENAPGVGPILNRLPHYPIWPGFPINTLFYAALLWLLIPGPFVLRRFLRVRHGLCPKCAYPIGESAVCTECGRELPQRVRPAT